MTTPEQRRYWIITRWRWWRYDYKYSYWTSVKLTFLTDIFYPIRSAYAWIWLKTYGHWVVDRKKLE